MLTNIRLAIFDVDGTLTDGIYQISLTYGIITKSFYTRDFYGLEQLMKNNVKVVIISQSCDQVIDTQINRICEHSLFWRECYYQQKLSLFTWIDNKKECVEGIIKKFDISWDNVSYMGDAENDLDCIKMAGFSGCPADAISSVKEEALYPSDYNGGKGAVYDFCMAIIEKINKSGDKK
jgi:3-deoxy-D-manno-octulosonate 8-phosphate phosphatase (KDO 8-P phosphatase)